MQIVISGAYANAILMEDVSFFKVCSTILDKLLPLINSAIELLEISPKYKRFFVQSI